MIVVCGEALIDVIAGTDGFRRTTLGGGPFNTARALGRLGVPTAFLGRLSDDRFGRELAAALVADGVSLELASVGPEPTTMAVAELDSGGSAIYRFELDGTSAPNLTAEMVPPHLDRTVSTLVVGSLGLSLEPSATTLVELVCREGGGRVVVLDPNVRVGARRDILEAVMAEATIVKASDADLAWLFPDADYHDAAEEMVRRGARLVVVTLGADGAFGAHRDLRVHVAARTVDVVDTIGAGDAFSAGLLAWLHDQHRLRPNFELDQAMLEGAVSYAVLAASLACARAGADPPSKDEIKKAMP